MGESRWLIGSSEIETLISEKELEVVVPSSEHADLLMRQAHNHLGSAVLVLGSDPAGAYAILYDAARKAMGAVLAQQGLRATNKNGHRATQEAIEAQLGQNARTVVRRFRTMRLRRHDAEYPGFETPQFTQEEATEALEDARQIVAAMARFLPNVGPWQ